MRENNVFQLSHGTKSIHQSKLHLYYTHWRKTFLQLLLLKVCESFIFRQIKKGEVYFGLYESSFTFLNLCQKFFPSHFRKFQAFFAIVFNNWGKTVIRLVFFSVSTIWTVKYNTKSFNFQIFIYFSLCYYLLQSLFLPASCSAAIFNYPP